MEKFEKSSSESPRERAERLYDSLPESMKTGYYGLLEGPYYKFKEEAGANAVPIIKVTAHDGATIGLHISLEAAPPVNEQIERVLEATKNAPHLKGIEVLWMPL